MRRMRFRIVQQADHGIGDGFGVAERNQDAAVVREQFARVPVGRGNHHLARSKDVGERAGGDLRRIQIGCQIDVGRADELREVLIGNEAVEENHVFADAEVSARCSRLVRYFSPSAASRCGWVAPTTR